MWLLLISTAYLCSVQSFDINDPKTNLDSLMKTIKSTFYNETCIYRFNGTVYSKKLGQNIVKLFYFDGFSIGRNIPQSNGGYLDLNRVFGVFRDLRTAEILRVWINPLTNNSVNEVFFVANDPDDYKRNVGPVTPTMMIPGSRVVFNTDKITEIPNPVDPKTYPKFSSGNSLTEVKFNAFFTDYLQLQKQGYFQTPFVGTFQRMTSYLPWMETGSMNGLLYYNGMTWKCYNTGLSCIPEDIWDHLSGEYDPFMQAPDGFDFPNVNEWAYFKNKVDQRRAKDKPDIIIPEVDINPKPHLQRLDFDPRVEKVLITAKFLQIYFNGTVHSKTIGTSSMHLFNVEGNVKISTLKLSNGDYSVTVNITGVYKDPMKGTILKRWLNPITNQTIVVPPIDSSCDGNVTREDVYTTRMTGVDDQWDGVGLLFTNSTNIWSDVQTLKEWSVDMVGAAFGDKELDSSSDPSFFGTFVRFTSWFKWMKCESKPGTLVLKTTFYKTVTE